MILDKDTALARKFVRDPVTALIDKKGIANIGSVDNWFSVQKPFINAIFLCFLTQKSSACLKHASGFFAPDHKNLTFLNDF